MDPGDDALQLIKGAIPDYRKRVPDVQPSADAAAVFDGSYVGDILKLLAEWRVSIGDIRLPRPDDLGLDIDTGKLFGGDFLGAVEKKFNETIDFAMDRVSGLFNGEQSELLDFLRSPTEKFNELFGLTKKCSGPGIIHSGKIPDACVVSARHLNLPTAMCLSQGPTFSFVIDGGMCIVEGDSGEVVCSRPSISLVKVPATCNLKYDSSTTVLVRHGLPCVCADDTGIAAQGHSCVLKKEFGQVVRKTIRKKGPTVNIGTDDLYRFLELDDLPLDVRYFFGDLL